MSLTSHLDDKSSWFRRFLERELPATPVVAAAYRARLPTEIDLVMPTPPDGVKPFWGTLATAIDHRLRCSLTIAEVGGVAASAVGAFGPGPVHETGLEMLLQMATLLQDTHPHDRTHPLLLDPAAEERLDRLCYASAWYEEVFRTGQVWPGTPLYDLAGSLTLASLLGAVPGFALADIRAVVQRAETGLAAVRRSTNAEDVRLGPTFKGSALVGGADADWIADGLLCDVKATTNPMKLKREDIWQLIGYALLDFDDKYQIQQAGWYVARAGCLIVWPIKELLALLGSNRPLADLREELSQVRGGQVVGR